MVIKSKAEFIETMHRSRGYTREQAEELRNTIIEMLNKKEVDIINIDHFVRTIIASLAKENMGSKTTNKFIDIIEGLMEEMEEQEKKSKQQEKKITSLKSKNKELEIQYEKLQKEHEEQKNVLENILTEQYVDLQERLHEIKACKPYEDFFEQIVLSLQKLLGFAEEADTLAEEKQEYYMWDVIADPVIETVRNMGGVIKRGMLCLPEETGALDREGIKEDIRGGALTELGRYIREDKLSEGRGKIALQKKAIVRELGILITELEKMDRSLPVDEEKVKRLAQETAMVLEEHGIYPMFAGDSRLEGYQELKKRFSSPNAYSIRYPGFFIKREGVWEVLGAHIGMDLVEGETSGNICNGTKER